MTANLHSRWDGPSAALLVAAVFTAAVRLDSTNWTPDLGYVETLAVFGTILGLALGLSRFGRQAVRWLVVFYTIVAIPMQLSRLITGEETVLGQLASLGGRLAVSLNFLINGKAVEDHVFFVTLMAILFWFVGIYSGHRLVKDGAILPVLLPSTLPILIIQYYDGYNPGRIWGLAFYFFLALLLAGRINLVKAGERWEEQSVLSGHDPEFDLNKNIASAAAIIILAAWVLPAPAAVLPSAARTWRNINQPFEAVRKRMDDILAALDSSRSNNVPGAMYGDAMGLGRTAGVGEAELFGVLAPENNLPRHYWRMRVYDQYQNGVWKAVNSQNTPFEPDAGDLEAAGLQGAPSAEFTFTWRSGRTTMLATPTQPIWASRKGSIQTTLNPGGETDLLSWSVSPGLRAGDQYQIRSILPNPTQKELRASGNDYPDWISERYLQVPADISDDYQRLAAQITGGLENNFDKAEAVTQYLRQNIAYSEEIPAPPPGVDPVNWFLFGWKSGFCNYYASAEVLMLRSLGIPARMVVGFAQGMSVEGDLYSVRGQDAHAWPEVYFPSIGWVQFEPTVNQAVLVRPSGEQVIPFGPLTGSDFSDGTRNNPRFDQEKDEFSSGETASPGATFLGLSGGVWLWIIIPIFAVAAGVLGWRWRQRSPLAKNILVQSVPRTVKSFFVRFNLKSPNWLDRWLRWSEVSAVERAFHAVNQALYWLRTPQPDYATPVERAVLLKAMLPDASQEIDILSTALENALFTSHPADASSAIRASWRLRFLTVRKIIRRLFYGE